VTAAAVEEEENAAGYAALEKELNRDLQRLWQRNLGRDDRCISDHGKEAWFPFLDEEVVSLLHSLSLPQIANMTLPPGGRIIGGILPRNVCVLSQHIEHLLPK